jgi:hypothetical protein
MDGEVIDLALLRRALSHAVGAPDIGAACRAWQAFERELRLMGVSEARVLRLGALAYETIAVAAFRRRSSR